MNVKVNYFSEPVAANEINTVLYHDRCLDGATAAFCAYLTLSGSAQYLACSYEDSSAIFEYAADKTLLFLDFSLKRAAFLKLQGLAKKVLVLDHHLTAQSELQGLSNVHIDLNKCGSSLAWRFFNPEKPQPKFIDYVEDVDLWRWQQKDSYYFSLGFYQYLKNNHFNFKTLLGIFSDEGILRFISEGQQLYTTFENQLHKACQQIVTVQIKYKNEKIVFGLIECQVKTLLNDIAVFALTNLEIDGLLLSYQYKLSQNKFSLRRLRDNNKISMNSIAERYSGGGHAHAASFFSNKMPQEVFYSIIDDFNHRHKTD